MKVIHVMRTYGANGGERQLSQLFGKMQWPELRESFIFVYRDNICALLFAERAPKLILWVLFNKSVLARTAWGEFFRLITLLPMLQWRLWRMLEQESPKICVVHGFQAALAAWPTIMFYRRIRWVYVHRITKAPTKLAPLFRLLYMPFDVVAGNSRSVMNSLAPFTSSKKLLALDNGIDLTMFDALAAKPPDSKLPNAPGKVLITVGRLLPHKGHELLIESFARIALVHPKLSWWIVGEGSEREKIKQRIDALGLSSCVHLLGYRKDVPAVLACADIFVNASSWEGMSNAVLEGMAARLPCVVADAPGVSECHIDGKTGLVVERTSIALTEGLERILADPHAALNMANAARLHVEYQYTIEANRSRYNALFARLVGNIN